MLTRALQEYGCLNKTIFILRYLLDEPFQRRIGAQINKGEGSPRTSHHRIEANKTDGIGVKVKAAVKVEALNFC